MKDTLETKTTGMRALTLEELNSSYEKLGVLLRREIRKSIFFKNGPWASIGFVYQEKHKSSWKPARVMLAMFKNMSGVFTRYSYFTIRNKEEAVDIIEFLKEAFDIRDEETA
jgi:hypothetical protein